MAKKKINPEDLQLNEEVVNHSVSPHVETTRNTCWDAPFPNHCDTTLTDQSALACTSVPEDKCNQSELVCVSDKCVSDGCNHTRSLGEICCDETAKGNCDSGLCPIPPASIEICPDSIKYCDPTNENCVAETILECESMDACQIFTNDCSPTIDSCPMTKDESCDLETNNCLAP